MPLKKRALRGLIILAVGIALCVLFSGTIRTLTTPKVRYSSVKQGKFENVTELKGKIIFPEEEAITANVPEGLSLTVTKVLVSPGQKVKKGEKLATAVVTDLEKTLATLQQEYDSAQNTLEAWERKNNGIRLTRGETSWMEAYDASREAEKKEREARLSVMAALALTETESLPETLPENATEEAEKAWKAWQEAREEGTKARSGLEGLSRHAIPEDVWTLLQQKREAEQKRADAEAQMMTVMLLSRRMETITAPHAGYIVAVSVEKGGTVTGESELMSLTPEDVDPLIRADISDVKQNVKKGTAVTVNSESWGRVESKVVQTGLSDSGHPFVDVEINQDVIYALGQISAILKDEISLRLTSRSQEATCLIPASAVRGSGDGRYVYIGEQESSAFAGTRITVRKMSVTVLAESATTVSVAEDLSRSKILYMEDRAISEGDSVMLYEE